MSLTKLALDARKARELAEAAGLQPHGNWKWALRQLRNGRGDLLQGRELAEAKAGLGKIPNNVRQKIEATARATGYRNEIATAIKDDPEWTKRLQGFGHSLESPTADIRQEMNKVDPRVWETPESRLFGNPDSFYDERLTPDQNFLNNTNHGNSIEEAFRDRNQSARARVALKQFFRDRRTAKTIQELGPQASDIKGALVDRLRQMGDSVSPFFSSPAQLRDQLFRLTNKNFFYRRGWGPMNVGTESGVSTNRLIDPTTQMHIHTHPYVFSKRYNKTGLNLENSKFGFLDKLERERIGATDARLVSPSGYVNRGNGKLQGDMSVYDQATRDIPNIQFGILDPLFGNEGIHKIRPQGLRSVYFKNPGVLGAPKGVSSAVPAERDVDPAREERQRRLAEKLQALREAKPAMPEMPAQPRVPESVAASGTTQRPRRRLWPYAAAGGGAGLAGLGVAASMHMNEPENGD